MVRGGAAGEGRGAQQPQRGRGLRGGRPEEADHGGQECPGGGRSVEREREVDTDSQVRKEISYLLTDIKVTALTHCR